MKMNDYITESKGVQTVPEEMTTQHSAIGQTNVILLWDNVYLIDSDFLILLFKFFRLFCL